MISQNLFQPEAVCHERIQHLASIALDVVETLLTDTETPINVRLNAAFRIFELCDANRDKSDVGRIIVDGIEKNARDINNNTHVLSYLETLLKGLDVSKGPKREKHRDVGESMDTL
ncbi:MAG: hypothetical protein DRR19_31075 [Candidatus Parabeggiatoa sp. nov. 1]|nr:MAG: hypothetical protein DRR19_31075 [Gammaproteobacteria bacterium]